MNGDVLYYLPISHSSWVIIKDEAHVNVTKVGVCI